MTVDDIEDTDQSSKGLARLARKLGYKDPFKQLMYDDGSVVGDLLEFLDDNPGACEAVIEWVLDNAHLWGVEEGDE